MYGKELRSAVLLIVAAVFVAFCVSASSGIAKKDTTKRQTVIIDAGHGGFDGGATAPDGTSEKDINLAVSLKLEKILTLYGYDVIMLRDTDTALNTEGDTTRSKKRSDIINRYAVWLLIFCFDIFSVFNRRHANVLFEERKEIGLARKAAHR